MDLRLISLIAAVTFFGCEAAAFYSSRNFDVDTLFIQFRHLKLHFGLQDQAFIPFGVFLDSNDEDMYARLADACDKIHYNATRRLTEVLDPKDRHYIQQIEYETGACKSDMKYKGYFLANVNDFKSIQGSFVRKNFVNWRYRLEIGDALSVLKLLPRYIDQTIGFLKKGVRAGIVYSKESMLNLDEDFSSLIVDNPRKSSVYVPFKWVGRAIMFPGIEDQIRVRDKVINNSVTPAFRRLYEYLKYDYSKHFRPRPGICSLKNGQEYYEAILRQVTTIRNVTAAEVHRTGLEGVAKLQREILALAHTELGLANLTTFGEIVHHIREKIPEQKFESKRQVLEHYSDIYENKIIPGFYKLFPIEGTPFSKVLERAQFLEIKKKKGWAYYYRGNVYVNLNDIGQIRKFETLSLALHESLPGHHLQETFNVMAYRQTPATLGSIGDFARMPSQLQTHTGHAEGWAHYAESLGHEMGLLEDPYDKLGFLSFDLFKEARLVVDTGIHSHCWSKQRAVKYFQENTFLSDFNIEDQIDQYITWPGQPTVYALGKRVISDLRRKLESEMGDEFKSCWFHFYVLSCKGALDLLESCVREQYKNPLLDVQKILASKSTAMHASYLILFLSLLLQTIP